MITQKEMTILVNTLSSIYNWSSENLEQDFIAFVKGESVSLSEDDLASIFNKFESVPILERESVYFDLEMFIKKNINQ